MSSIFAYIDRSGNGPDLDRLRRIAVAKRRNDAVSMAWQDADGTIRTNIAATATGYTAKDTLNSLDMVVGAKIIIGQFTQRENSLYPIEGGYIVKDGEICNHRDIAHLQNIQATQSEIDVFGHVLRQKGGLLHSMFAQAAEECEGHMAIIGLWRDNLAIVRRGYKVHMGLMKNGDIYFSSLASGLPGTVRMLEDDYAIGITINAGVMMKFQRVVPKAVEHPILFRGA